MSLRRLCNWLRYKATSGLRGAKVWSYLCCWINFGRVLSSKSMFIGIKFTN